MIDYTETPILILIFNRPDKVQRMVDRLRQFKPKHIYISADGPREDRPDERRLCLEAQEITTSIDWPCEVHTRFSDINLGCKKSVSTGISWFFSLVESGIILEDDCLPTEAFLVFATDMLKRYRDNYAVMHINGTSFLPATRLQVGEPFFFSRLAHSWGWASWRRAWKEIDLEMLNAEDMSTLLCSKKIFRKKYADFWSRHFVHIRKRKVDSWANPWLYTILKNDGLCVTPAVSLIENIGFDTAASNTKYKPDFVQNARDQFSHMHEPESLAPNRQADEKITDLVFRKTFFEKLLTRLRNAMML